MQNRPLQAPRRFQQLSLLPDASVVAAQAARCLRGWCLAVTGEQALSWWGPLVVEAVSARYAGNARTAEKAAAEAHRLFRYLDARGAAVWADVTAGLVLDWCWAARRDRSGVHGGTAQSTARNRQWAASAAFGEAARLGAPIDASVLVGARIARPGPARHRCDAFDPRTGRTRRHDPDADYYHHSDGKRSGSPGRGLVFLTGRNPYPNERILFGHGFMPLRGDPAILGSSRAPARAASSACRRTASQSPRPPSTPEPTAPGQPGAPRHASSATRGATRRPNKRPQRLRLPSTSPNAGQRPIPHTPRPRSSVDRASVS